MGVTNVKESGGKQGNFGIDKQPAVHTENMQKAKDDVGNKETQKEGVAVDISKEVMDLYLEQLEACKKEDDSASDLAKILEIARRISKGDQVPYSDEKKLIEYNPKLYQASKAAAMLNANKKHKKYKALFQDDDEKSMEEKVRDLDRESSRDNIEINPAGDAIDTETENRE